MTEFIIDFCKKNKIRFIDLDDINSETTLEVDLNMNEYLIDDFLEEFVRKFNIDYSEFDANKYLIVGKYNFIILDFLRLIFGYKKKWVKEFAHSNYNAPLTVGILQKAIKNGKLK